MFKGLVKVVQGILGNRDIGPVPITVSIKPNISEGDIEQLRRELQSRGFRVGRYVHIEGTDFRIIECLAPKEVYEGLFSMKVTAYRPFNNRNYALEYKDLQTPEIPLELRDIITSVSVAQKVYAAH